MTPFEQYIQQGISAFRQTWTPKIERLIGVIILVGSLSFLTIVLFRSWNEVRPYFKQIDGWLLVAGQFSTILALIFGGIMWYLIQKSTGLGFSWWESLSIQFTSGIAKYIPGYAWQYLSKAYMSQRKRAGGKRITFAMLTEFILLVLGGIILASLWAWKFSDMWKINLSLPSWGWLLLVGGALSCVFIWTSWGKRLGILDLSLKVKCQLCCALLMGIIGWILLSFAAWLITLSLYPIGVGDFPQFVFALVLSGIISILVIVVPGGIGIREATLAALLVGSLPFSLGVVVSILVRLSVVIAELIAFFLSLTVTKSRTFGMRQ